MHALSKHRKWSVVLPSLGNHRSGHLKKPISGVIPGYPPILYLSTANQPLLISYIPICLLVEPNKLIHNG